ncbi:uncharacterized protein [Triticum aestivum]|uniref:uncharacterized protein isoform X1 n=1 Tax=Triticum aestivum TaxID=4565 RepID=UPI001D010627|nr:uncharacterized protein LOC123081825 isoform X1 [Triticum aestivum]
MVPLCTGLFNNPCVAHVKPPPCQSPSHAAGAPGLSRTSSPIGTVPPPPSPRCTPLLLPLRPESVASSASMQENDGLAHAHLQRQQGCADPLSQGQAAGLPCACLPQISVEPAPFGPRAAGEHHQAQCTGSAPPSLLFAGAPVPQIRRGAAVPSSSRALALSVQLRRCLPSTPLLDPLLQGRDDGRPRRALTSPARPSACVQPTGPGPMFGFVPEL